jgi:hypothetical protein
MRRECDRVRQSLDGIILRIIRARTLNQVKCYDQQLFELLNNFTKAKAAFNNSETDIVKEFFDYYVVEKPQQSGEQE